MNNPRLKHNAIRSFRLIPADAWQVSEFVGFISVEAKDAEKAKPSL